MKNEKIISTFFIIIGIIALIVLIYSFTNQSFTNENCQLYWDVSNYSSDTGILNINFVKSNIHAYEGGTACPESAGTSSHNINRLNIATEKECTEIFGSSAIWTTQGNGVTGCYLQDDNSWIKDKPLSYAGGCLASDNKGFVPTSGFTGTTFYVPQPECYRCFTYNCDMTISVQVKEIQTCTQDNCISPCEGKTASCSNNQCIISGECKKSTNWLLITGAIIIAIAFILFLVFFSKRKN